MLECVARIFPFQPFRYAPSAGSLADLLTQPYDKISPSMQARYLAASPHNLVRVILGERFPGDTDTDNVYTRSAEIFNRWIREGVLQQDPEPAVYAYFQEFTPPDSNESVVRQGFIGLGALEDYSRRIVHRHEQTLTGPKKDRTRLLAHTHAHFGQIFMLYPDRAGAVDRILEAAAEAAPVSEVTDEYETVHRLWRISDPGTIATIQSMMADKKLLIADGHHRYETALAFRDAHPEIPGSDRVMMTFVNMHSPGLVVLATHRLVSGLDPLDLPAFFARVEKHFHVRQFSSADAFRKGWEGAIGDAVRIGGVVHGGPSFLLEKPRGTHDLDVKLLHEEVLGHGLGIGEEAVRDEKHLRYMRGFDAAIEEAESGRCQIAFLLHPTPVDQVAEVAFGGGVMPQKSTDFYPKLLTGMTIYRLE